MNQFSRQKIHANASVTTQDKSKRQRQEKFPKGIEETEQAKSKQINSGKLQRRQG